MTVMLAGLNTGKRKDGAMDIYREIHVELERAESLFAPIHSKSEAAGILREEYLEVEGQLFHGDLRGVALRSELIQLAAMCVRSIKDLGLSDV